MIQIKHPRTPLPKVFTSAELRREKLHATAFFALTADERDQRGFDWKRTMQLLRDGCLEQLNGLFHHKCAYCETPLRDTFVNLDHFRPRNGALGLDGSFSADHYWWLAFEWPNCFPICQLCDSAKSQRFPVAKSRINRGRIPSLLRAEQALLLDPGRDEPEKHLVFGRSGLVSSSTSVGQCTIEVLALNREPLVQERAHHIDLIDILVGQVLTGDKAAFQQLRSHMSPAAPFLASKRQFIRRMAKELRSGLSDRDWELLQVSGAATKHAMNLGGTTAAESQFQRILKSKQRHSVEDEGKAARRAYFSGVRRIERIEILNFKKIRNLELIVPPASRRESWLAVLGENSTGKSSLLQAIALALLGKLHLAKLDLDARQFLTHGESSGYVKVHLTNVFGPVELHFSAETRSFRVKPSRELVLLLGYGATRLLPRSWRPDHTPERYIRVKNLFDPYARLQHAERWLTDADRLSDRQFVRASLALKKLLLLEDQARIRRQGSKLLIEIDDDFFTLRQLSDGYQSIVALAVDIMMGVITKWERVELAEGIILIDEIESHLHPIWKLEIVSRFRRVFPRMQFFVTTHEPLCLRGLAAGEIVVFRRGTNGLSVQVVTEDLSHLRADQLLTSHLFGLVSTRDPEIQRDTDRFSELLSSSNLSKNEDKELTQLRDRLKTGLLSGETSADRQIENVIREAALTITTESESPQQGTVPLSSPGHRDLIQKLVKVFA